MIHVPYDLEHLQVGCLFIVPSGLDNAEGRLFRVINMQNIMMYPASIACEIAPEYYFDSETSQYLTSNINVSLCVLYDKGVWGIQCQQLKRYWHIPRIKNQIEYLGQNTLR